MSPCQPGTEQSFFFFFLQIFGLFFWILGLKNEYRIPGEQKKNTVRQRVDRDSQNTSLKLQDIYLENDVNVLPFVRKNT